ncbi:hypothetical protein BDN71DRAFT_1214234 [Pleurotus eryngii]|uniref:Secreted protein n=1 Tax=Pleurotus eryngii TaxID=5323 RepID=A0A9P5ZRR1_PLEER|nr:hypothetical protein BDN71DRAFT_1214234 [Pleurotus eryngii]
MRGMAWCWAVFVVAVLMEGELEHVDADNLMEAHEGTQGEECSRENGSRRRRRRAIQTSCSRPDRIRQQDTSRVAIPRYAMLEVNTNRTDPQ